MISRRTFLTASAVVLAAPAVLGPLSSGAGATGSTLTLALTNTTGSDTVYAYVTGTALNNGNALFLLQADGRTPYYPASPAADGTPLAVDCAIPLGASGSAPTSVTIPYLGGCRVWFSIGAPLQFFLNPGPGLVEPSVTNASDANIDTVWDFCELTFNGGVYANISMVDFACIPIALQLTGSAGTQTVAGLPAGGLDRICAGLTAQQAVDGAGWNQLIVTSGGANLRALSPTNGIVYNPSLLSGYFDGYLNQVWQKYTTSTLSVDTQGSWGTVTGQVVNGLLTFPGVGSFAQPSSADIFSCASGPFSVSTQEMSALVPRISAALNRTTLLTDAAQPDGENPADYYTNAQTNHYARIVHSVALDHRGYAFPYDDVGPNGGTDQSGFVSDGAPTLLTITVGAVHATGSSPLKVTASAYSATNSTGTEATADTGGGDDVGWINSSSWLRYDGVDFAGGYGNLQLRLASAVSGSDIGTVQFRLDSLTATPFATVAVSGTGGWQSWTTSSTGCSPAPSGSHTLYVTFTESVSGNFVNLNWFEFS
ncbi:beta-1,3-glucanase family protein [Streptacidiphilus albus]|uniref:beta-1,3-glucanase family protein n=1 Tax=Streptacidiphilus albus TaxID=105425 RepID=UPI00054C0EB9|nr:beta-1,3-glucanase family protein [Streptacidiphilus albus]